jgi:CYTH domain-containing protein
MPIEVEYKFVLKDIEALREELTHLAALDPTIQRLHIKQGYLPKTGRVRSINIVGRPVEYVFTYKLDLTNNPSPLEFEHNISEDDFVLAWPECKTTLEKNRFKLPYEGRVWEVDLFENNGLYFAQAELEVPEGSGPPDRLHPLVAKYLAHRVDLGDSRFNNKKLADKQRAEELFKEIV